VGAEFFQADERTDGRNTNRWIEKTKLVVAFRNFENTSKNCYVTLVLVVITLILKISLTKSYTSRYKVFILV